MKMLYLHGFASSGASGTIGMLRREFYARPAKDRLEVVAPDIPVDPNEAMTMLTALVKEVDPVIIVGTSMGGFYTQMLRGYPRICVNPSFVLSKFYSHYHVGKYRWLNPRKDGETEFHIYKETIEALKALEARQFEGITDLDRSLCYGLFADADEFGSDSKVVFDRLYPGQSRVFSGGHRLNDNAVKNALLPFIDKILY